jgi:dUTP pyrophosphatase
MILYSKLFNSKGVAMNFQAKHPNFKLPVRASDKAGGLDLFMPESGNLCNELVTTVPLGFAAEVPEGHVALILPRSGTGGKYGVELNNTCGVIDSDYRDEWVAKLSVKRGADFHWNAGDRVLQVLIVPILQVNPVLAPALSLSERKGGFGSTGT